MVAHRVYCSKAQRLIDLKLAKLEVDRLNSQQLEAKRERELLQLSQATGFTNKEMLERLHRAGFSHQNIEALQWLPLAMVAWASDGVSAAEVEAAKLLHLHPQAMHNQAALQLLQTWFAQRPSPELCKLWEEATVELATTQSPEVCRQTGQMILELAKRVARASGGFLGFGEISAAERDVLDRIRSIYGLDGW